ncbi:MAG: hypothetical protein KDE27_08925, partial [Planctomycetes bacterium]|nr:hypothetical protein [Planctomycetota bacterium]
SLEPSFRDLLPRGLDAERDDEVAREINGCLAERPWRRMFVIRGEAHTVPDGYLCRQLRSEPIVVLSCMSPPLEALGDDPDTVGRTFRLDGVGGPVFWCGVEEPMALSERFHAWLTR